MEDMESKEECNESPSSVAPAPGTCPMYTAGLTLLLFAPMRLLYNTSSTSPSPRGVWMGWRRCVVNRLVLESVSFLQASHLCNTSAGVIGTGWEGSNMWEGSSFNAAAALAEAGATRSTDSEGLLLILTAVSS